jgi:hypothetical protein
MASSGMLRSVALVRTDVSDEVIASIIRVTRIRELRSMSASTSNRSALRVPLDSAKLFLVVDSCLTDDGGDTFLRNLVATRVRGRFIAEDGILDICNKFVAHAGYHG